MISIWDAVVSNYKGDLNSIHGPRHWKRDSANGLEIALTCGADIEIVQLFALLHDSCRVSDIHDMGHGEQAALYAAKLRGKFLDLDDRRFGLLQHALAGHAHGKTSPDPTIGTCWDADRLELTRCGIQPDPALMSTEAGRRMAQALLQNRHAVLSKAKGKGQ